MAGRSRGAGLMLAAALAALLMAQANSRGLQVWWGQLAALRPRLALPVALTRRSCCLPCSLQEDLVAPAPEAAEAPAPSAIFIDQGAIALSTRFSLADCTAEYTACKSGCEAEAPVGSAGYDFWQRRAEM